MNSTTIKPNALKISFNENEFIVSFAESVDKDKIDNEVNLLFTPEQVMPVVAPLVDAVVRYQEQFGKNIGLQKKGDNNEQNIS